MRRQLRYRTLVDEDSAVAEHARDLPQSLRGLRDVVAGAEVDHSVEHRVLERQGPHVAPHELGRDAGGACGFEESRVDVDADKAARPQAPGELRECDARTAANLKDPGVVRHAEEAEDRRDLESGLNRVPPCEVRKRPIAVELERALGCPRFQGVTLTAAYSHCCDQAKLISNGTTTTPAR